jgi:cell division protein FtsB
MSPEEQIQQLTQQLSESQTANAELTEANTKLKNDIALLKSDSENPNQPPVWDEDRIRYIEKFVGIKRVSQ